MDVALLNRNLQRRLLAIATYFLLVENRNISGKARSDYNRAIMLLSASVVEGLVCFLILKKNNWVSPVIYVDKKREIVYSVPQQIFGVANIAICKLQNIDVVLSDRDCNFDKMNKFCKNKGYISETEYRRLDYVRKKRNKIHVHSLVSEDIGYTGKTNSLIGEAMDFLIAKL